MMPARRPTLCGKDKGRQEGKYCNESQKELSGARSTRPMMTKLGSQEAEDMKEQSRKTTRKWRLTLFYCVEL